MTVYREITEQQFINLETFRKSGIGVKTPVWFVQDGDTIYVRTIANSGKVKRIRNSGRANITPCKADGTPLDNWWPMSAREIHEEAVHQKVDRLLDRKYGLMKKMFALASTLQGQKYTVLEIKGRDVK